MFAHTTYVVYYSNNGSGAASRVFKYGITSIPHYQTRADVGKKNCNAWSKKRGYRQVCRVDWIGVSTFTFGWDYGRFLEASMIKDYERANGVFPPGNPVGR